MLILVKVRQAINPRIYCFGIHAGNLNDLGHTLGMILFNGVLVQLALAILLIEVY